MRKTTVISILFVLTALTVFGQEKSIGQKSISTTIQKYIQVNYPAAKRIKYYQEYEQGTTFIEAEFKQNQTAYSLKFNADSLVETEIDIKFSSILANVQQKITSNLDSLFNGYKILSCQEVNPTTNPLYEINVKTKSGNYMELYYDKSGTLIKKIEIIVKPISSQF